MHHIALRDASCRVNRLSAIKCFHLIMKRSIYVVSLARTLRYALREPT